MSSESQMALADFCRACASYPEIQMLLHTQPSATDLAHVIKKHAFRQVTAFPLAEHHFMVTLLDTIDWELLAEQVLARNSCQMQQPFDGKMAALMMPRKAS